MDAVVNHLWQSTIFTAVVALLALALGSNRAAVRFWLWFAASAKFLIPFAALLALGSQFPWRPASTIATPAMTGAIGAIGEPFSQAEWPLFISTGTARSSNLPDALLPFLAALWMCGSLLVIFRWAARWRRIGAIVRQGTPSAAGRELEILRRIEAKTGNKTPIALVMADSSLEPGLFGIVAPVLVWPQQMSLRLDDEQIAAILAHEVCHARRRDNLFATIHMLVGTIFWFHPLVWWIGGRLVDERERACDEEVITLGSQPQVYAQSILTTCEFCIESPLVNVAGVTGSDLKKRIVAIASARMPHRLNPARKLLLASVAVAAVTWPVVAGLLHASSAQATPEPRIAIEVASIRPSKETGPNFRPQSGGFSATGITVQLLLQVAYGVQHFEISGLPGWARSDAFDIIAKVEGASGMIPDDQRQQLLQVLLADRFQLRLRRETREESVYAMVVDKGGHKLQVAAGMRPGYATVQRGYLSGTMDIPALNRWLAWRLERPVLDNTELSGQFDIELIWVPDAGQLGAGIPAPVPPPPPPPPPPGRGDLPKLPRRTPPPQDPSSPGLFTALREQLGLRLDARKAPVEILVIDSVQRPSEN